MNGISDRLKLLRGSLSQQKFAESIGLKQTTYGQYERGVTSPSTEIASQICQKLGLNPRWLILGEEPMYDAEASQERPRIKAGDLVGKSVEELPADIGRSLKKARKAVQAWGQRWDELPDWAKEYIEELEEELEEAKVALLKAKDEAISAQSMALRRTDTLVDNIMKALEDKGFMYTTEELFEAMKSCSTAAELDKLIKQGRKK